MVGFSAGNNNGVPIHMGIGTPRIKPAKLLRQMETINRSRREAYWPKAANLDLP